MLTILMFQRHKVISQVCSRQFERCHTLLKISQIQYHASPRLAPVHGWCVALSPHRRCITAFAPASREKIFPWSDNVHAYSTTSTAIASAHATSQTARINLPNSRLLRLALARILPCGKSFCTDSTWRYQSILEESRGSSSSSIPINFTTVSLLADVLHAL